MKSIKKLSFLLAIYLIFVASFSIAAFSADSTKEIEENDKIYAKIPFEYDINVLGDDLAYNQENGNYIEFCVDENKFAPDGITVLKDWQAEKVFEHYYLNEGELESINNYAIEFEKVEKTTANGYNCYYLAGEYAFNEDAIDSAFAYYFHAAVFATKEEIFIVVFESYEKISKFYDTDLPVVLSGIVFNGTHFENDKPENNDDHDFSASPAYSDVVTSLQGALFGDMFEDGSMVAVVSAVIILFTVAPTLILVIIAVTLVIKYIKNKKKLAQYEATYGKAQAYNPMQQNYNGYCYNPQVNQPYQTPVKPLYQPNTVNQSIPQTPSYVSNAVTNLEAKEEKQPASISEEQADSQNN